MSGSAGSFKDHFSADAARYAVFRPVYPPLLVDWLASLCPSKGLALDVGCGSGQLSWALARRFERVVATDASAEQIAKAVASPKVRYVVAPAERSGLEGGTADLVVAAQAAHWFELEAFYAEVKRVVRPGGIVALVCYERCVIDGGAIDAAVERLYSGRLGAFWPPERRHVESGYRNLPFPFDELPASEVPRLEMTESWTRGQLLGYVATWSAVRRASGGVAGGDADVLRPFAAELREVWPVEGKMVVRWPLSVRVGRFGG